MPTKSLFFTLVSIGKQSFNGSLGFSGRFSNITFRGNVATEFGGGFACTVTPSSSVVFESKSEIEPLEFENWYV